LRSSLRKRARGAPLLQFAERAPARLHSKLRGWPAGTVRGANLDSFQVLFAGAHRNPTLARRAQVLSERQRVRNHSKLRLLVYPELGCRRRLPRLKIAAADAAAPSYFHAGWSRRAAGSTTWKKNERRAAPAEGRGAIPYSLRELLAPSKPCPHPGAARGPEVPYARPPTPPQLP